MLEVLKGLEGCVASVISKVRSKVDVEDVLQEAAVDILKGYQSAARKKAMWVAKSARTKAWRDARRDHARLVGGENPKQEVHFDPLADLVKSEEIASLEAAMGGLDADTAIALKLRFYEGATFEEIADAFDVSQATAVRMVNRGLKALREVICE